jgi:hypothetical protein
VCLERESSDLVVTYQNRLKFLAYSKQASHGKYSENGPDSDAGWFDVIGNDRRFVLTSTVSFMFANSSTILSIDIF